jgi:hypothetical protein
LAPRRIHPLDCTKVHSSPEWMNVGGKHPGVSALTKDEIYNRYIEVLPEKW